MEKPTIWRNPNPIWTHDSARPVCLPWEVHFSTLELGPVVLPFETEEQANAQQKAIIASEKFKRLT